MKTLGLSQNCKGAPAAGLFVKKLDATIYRSLTFLKKALSDAIQSEPSPSDGVWGVLSCA